MELTPELFGPCVRTIVMRIVLQAVMIVCVLLAVHSFIGSNKLLDHGSDYLYVRTGYVQYADFP